MCSPTAKGVSPVGYRNARALPPEEAYRKRAQRPKPVQGPMRRAHRLPEEISKTYPFIRLLTANAHVLITFVAYDHKCVAMPRGNRAVIPVRCHGHSSLRDATMQAEERVALHLPVGSSEISLAYQKRSSRCGSTPGSSRTTAMKSRSCLYPPPSGRQEARREECPC